MNKKQTNGGKPLFLFTPTMLAFLLRKVVNNIQIYY